MKKSAFVAAMLLMCVMADAVNVIRNSAPADTNQWIIFRKVVNVTGDPAKNFVKIAADSKYWLWVNGELEVFEGGLKRGPNHTDTYVDNVKLKHLKKGENTIAVLVWYYGRQGFSHRSSGTAGLYFDMTVGGKHYVGDGTWKTKMHPAYYTPAGELPNYRLPESNIGFNAQKDISNFYTEGYDDSSWENAGEIDLKSADWNALVERPIGQWKDYGMKHYLSQRREGNKVICAMPYNAQVTPYLKVKAPAGKVIDMRTDDYMGGGTTNVFAEYVTKDGVQEYENFGWMNGHDVIYTIPEGVEVIDLGYRETGYDCEFTGKFSCDNADMNSLWTKSQRTLYITMRDSYMDCPDRERAQWIGDVSNEMVETFYSLSPSASLLTRKCAWEMADWQKPDSVMYAPVPAGNWDRELPMQTMAFIGLGDWNYYMGSGDKATIEHIFPANKRYMDKWVMQDDGLVTYRPGAWDWGDWGYHQDMQSMCQLWYAITCDNYAKQANLLGHKDEAEWALNRSASIKKAFHEKFWTGAGYRNTNYNDSTDDRVQALAVLAGVAPKSEYEWIKDFLMKTYFASPYMERYVLEAMCEMGYVKEAKKRMLDRYMPMIKSKYTTLWEIFGMGKGAEFNGTYNHAWSGGPLIIMSKYIAGVAPVKPGFKEFQVRPEMCDLKRVSATVPTEYGNITVDVNSENGYKLTVRVPKGTKANLVVPAAAGGYELDGRSKTRKAVEDGTRCMVKVGEGLHTLKLK